jgi:hypothetical protein
VDAWWKMVFRGYCYLYNLSLTIWFCYLSIKSRKKIIQSSFVACDVHSKTKITCQNRSGKKMAGILLPLVLLSKNTFYRFWLSVSPEPPWVPQIVWKWFSRIEVGRARARARLFHLLSKARSQHQPTLFRDFFLAQKARGRSMKTKPDPSPKKSCPNHLYSRTKLGEEQTCLRERDR